MAQIPSSERTDAQAEPMAVRPGINASIRAGSSIKWRQPEQFIA
jgi:hypothetical protein